MHRSQSAEYICTGSFVTAERGSRNNALPFHASHAIFGHKKFANRQSLAQQKRLASWSKRKWQRMETTPDKPRHCVGAIVLLVSNLLLALILCFILGFVVPVYTEMFQDFGGPLPTLAQVVAEISNSLRTFYGVGLWLLICILFALLVRMYLFHHRNGNRKALFIRLWLTLIVFSVLTGIIIFALLCPVFRVGDLMTVTAPTSANNKDVKNNQ
jgi:hypothetical protein